MTDLFQRAMALLREGTVPVLMPLILVCAGIWVLIVERTLYLYGPEALFGWIWPPARKKLSEVKRKISLAVDAYLKSPSFLRRREALDLCRSHLTPYTSFLFRVLRDAPETPRDLKDLQLAEAALREEIRIEKGLGVLSTLAKLAPLLGLLGTVHGMIQTFRVMMLSSTSDPRALSSGISIALIATEVGLAVALPGVIGTSWLHRRAQTLIEEIRLVSIRFRQPGSEEGIDSSDEVSS